MKKKKLKKEIKELRKDITRQREMISTLSVKYTNISINLADLMIKYDTMKNSTNDINRIVNHMTIKDIVHWCTTHPDPEKKKQYEEELSRAIKMYFNKEGNK